MFIYWLYSFAKRANDPVRVATVSIIAWIVLWEKALAMLNCPVACQYRHNPRRRYAFVALAILASAQWLASVYVAVTIPALREATDGQLSVFGSRYPKRIRKLRMLASTTLLKDLALYKP